MGNIIEIGNVNIKKLYGLKNPKKFTINVQINDNQFSQINKINNEINSLIPTQNGNRNKVNLPFKNGYDLSNNIKHIYFIATAQYKIKCFDLENNRIEFDDLEECFVGKVALEFNYSAEHYCIYAIIKAIKGPTSSRTSVKNFFENEEEFESFNSIKKVEINKSKNYLDENIIYNNSEKYILKLKVIALLMEKNTTHSIKYRYSMDEIAKELGVPKNLISEVNSIFNIRKTIKKQ